MRWGFSHSQIVNFKKLILGYYNPVTYTLPRTGGSHEKGGQLMEKEKKTFVDWVKEHKKELIIAGVSIAAIIAVIVGIKNHKALEEA